MCLFYVCLCVVFVMYDVMLYGLFFVCVVIGRVMVLLFRMRVCCNCDALCDDVLCVRSFCALYCMCVLLTCVRAFRLWFIV